MSRKVIFYLQGTIPHVIYGYLTYECSVPHYIRCPFASLKFRVKLIVSSDIKNNTLLPLFRLY